VLRVGDQSARFSSHSSMWKCLSWLASRFLPIDSMKS
jgi:hypothetical protein